VICMCVSVCGCECVWCVSVCVWCFCECVCECQCVWCVSVLCVSACGV